MRNLKITVMLVALVGLLAFAGCGGDDDDSTSASSETAATTTATDSTATDETTSDDSGDDYGSELSGILVDFGASFQEIGADIQGSKDPQDYVDAFDSFESEINKTIDDIEALDPPEEAQQGQDDLVAALESFSKSIGDFGDELSGGDPSKIQDALTKFQKEATTFQQDATDALAEIADSGVSVQGGLGG